MNTSEILIVLMADDDDDDCMLAKDAFDESGVNGALRCVENGLELMDYLFSSNPRPVLILLDLNMPQKDGRQALKEIKAIPALQSIPIVVLTTSQEERDVFYCREMGANSFVTKPASFTEWIEIMKSLANYWISA